MDAHELECYEKAGKVARMALEHGARQIAVGVRIRDVLDSIEQFIREQGLEPAFPAQSCVNEVAAHFCPKQDDPTTYRQGDLIKLDVGVHCEGFVGDNALTISLDSPHAALSDATRLALENVEKMLKPGVTLDEIGRTIATTLRERGFEPIRNLSGHGLAQYTLHAEPSIPNYPTGEDFALEEGMVVAIEPFGTTGEGLIYNASDATVFSLGPARPIRTPYGRAVLQEVAKYSDLPFTTAWLTRALGNRALLGLTELRRSGMLHEYPPLPEKSGGIVAQWENTFLITKDGCRVLTRNQ